MTNRVDILIRADASPQIGWGHVSRCLSLAQALVRQTGLRVGFASHEVPECLRDRAEAAGICVIELDAHAAIDGAAFVEAISPLSVSCVLADHYGLPADWYKAVRAAGYTLVAVEDAPGQAVFADILVNTAPLASERYEDLEVSGAASLGAAQSHSGQTRLLGSQYALLDPAFAQVWNDKAHTLRAGHMGAVAALSPLAPFDPTALNIVVAFGAIRSFETVKSFLPALQALLGARLNVTLVSTAADQDDAVENFGSARVRVVSGLSPRQLAELFARADFYVGAAGTMALEAASMGLPLILVPTVDNQREQARALSETGAAITVDVADIQTRARLVFEACYMLSSTPHQRAHMARVARELCDGRGAERVASYIADQLQNEGPDYGGIRLNRGV